MKRTSPFLMLLTFWMVVSLACNLPAQAKDSKTGTPGTPAAGTQGPAVMSALPPTVTITPAQSPTTAPANPTAVPPATSTTQATPCNWAQFVADITYPDDTAVKVGTTFVKTWRLKNVGSCAWAPGYQIIYASGDQMNAPASSTLTNTTIQPGGTVDVSLNLKAPDAAGTYQGFFKLRATDGQEFGIGPSANQAFWVKIVAEATAPIVTLVSPPLVLPKPDLIISEFSLNPATPVMGSPVHVRIGVYNDGTAPAGPYTVKWYGLKTYASPSCSWDVDKSNAKGGRILECDFTFPSWYGPSTTRAIADADNTVNESNEGNNIGDYPIQVKQP